MTEIMTQLELLAYLAGQADSVKARRELDAILRMTNTRIDSKELRTVGTA